MSILRLLLLGLSLLALFACERDPAGPEVPEVERELRAYLPELLDRINVERGLAGRPALVPVSRLMNAAQLQAAQMAEVEAVSPVIPGSPYPTLADRLRVSGYRAREAWEVLASGPERPSDVMEFWINSPGHRTELFSDRAEEVGVGVARDRQGHLYWSVVLGRR